MIKACIIDNGPRP